MHSDIEKAPNRDPLTTARVGKALFILGLVTFLLPIVIAGIDAILMWSRILPVIQSLSSQSKGASPPMPEGYMAGLARWFMLEIVAFGPAGSLMILAGAITTGIARRQRVFRSLIDTGGHSHR